MAITDTFYTSETFTITQNTTTLATTNFKVANENAVAVYKNGVVVNESEYDLFVENVLPGKVTITFNNQLVSGDKVIITVKDNNLLYNSVADNFDGKSVDRQEFTGRQITQKKIDDLKTEIDSIEEYDDAGLAKRVEDLEAEDTAIKRDYKAADSAQNSTISSIQDHITNSVVPSIGAGDTATLNAAKEDATTKKQEAINESKAYVDDLELTGVDLSKYYDKHLTDIKGSNDKVSFPANKVLIDLTCQAIKTPTQGSHAISIANYLNGIEERNGPTYAQYENLPASGTITGDNNFTLYGTKYKLSALGVRGDLSAIQTAANALQMRFDSVWQLHELDMADFWGKHKMVVSRGDESITIDHMWIDYGYTLAPRWSCDDSTNPYLVDADGNPNPPGKTNGTQISNDFVPESEEAYWTTALATKMRGIMSNVEGETFNLKLIQDKFTFYSGVGVFDILPEDSVGFDGYKCIVADKEYTRTDGAWVLDEATDGLSDEKAKQVAALIDLGLRREVKFAGQNFDAETVPTLSTGQSGAISLRQQNPPRVRFIYPAAETKSEIDSAFLGRLLTLTIDGDHSISLNVLSHERTLNIGSGYHAEEYAVGLHEYFHGNYQLNNKDVSVYLPPEEDGYNDDEIDTAIATAKTEVEETIDAKFTESYGSELSWLKYFDYYYIGADGLNTNISGAGQPVPQGGAIYSNGQFSYDADGEWIQLPNQVSNGLAAADVVILGAIAHQTGSDLHPLIFEAADNVPLMGIWTRDNYLTVNNGNFLQLSDDDTVLPNVEYGLATVLRTGSITGFINGVEARTVNSDWNFAPTDVLHLNDGATLRSNGDFFGTMKQVIIMRTNAAYDSLTTSEKNAAVASAGVWASTHSTSKNIKTKGTFPLVPRETKVDRFISPAHITTGQYAAVKLGGTGDLGVGTTEVTPSEAGATEYANINIAITYADWNKCYKVGISSSHATSVMLNLEEYIYKTDLNNTLTMNQIASADGRNSARVRLYENQNELGTRSTSTHRLEISGTVGRVYIGKVRLISLELV